MKTFLCVALILTLLVVLAPQGYACDPPVSAFFGAGTYGGTTCGSLGVGVPVNPCPGVGVRLRSNFYGAGVSNYGAGVGFVGVPTPAPVNVNIQNNSGRFHGFRHPVLHALGHGFHHRF